MESQPISRPTQLPSRARDHFGFADTAFVTLPEGAINELHIGLKVTMGALYLKDLADKTRRGRGWTGTKVWRGRRGDVLFVKALTLHRSRSSARQTGRRTLRIDYCAGRLPPPLAWAF